MGNRRFPAKETQTDKTKRTDTHSEKIPNRSRSRFGTGNYLSPSNETVAQPHAQLHRLLVAARRRHRILVCKTPTYKKALRKSSPLTCYFQRPTPHSEFFEYRRL